MNTTLRFPIYEILFMTVILLCLLASITLIVLYVYAEIVYGNTALADCPCWVLWLFKGDI